MAPNYNPYDPITFEDSHSITPSILTDLVKSNEALEVLVSQASIYLMVGVPVIMKGITLEQEILNIPTKEILKYEGENIPILIGRGMSKYTN